MEEEESSNGSSRFGNRQFADEHMAVFGAQLDVATNGW
jgi:hypothetical protein